MGSPQGFTIKTKAFLCIAKNILVILTADLFLKACCAYNLQCNDLITVCSYFFQWVIPLLLGPAAKELNTSVK